MQSEKAKLIFFKDKGKDMWICSKCGAKYKRGKEWIPPTNYCMKCKTTWENC